jgi:ABC-2 type transport system permease protein
MTAVALDSPRERRSSLRRDLTLAAWQVRNEQRAFWRNRRAAVFSFGFPIMLLLVFGLLNRNNTIDTRGGVSWDEFYVPGILAYGLVATAFSNIAISLAYARDYGVIKRIQGTPLPWWVFMAGRIGSTVLVTAAMSALTLAIGVVVLGVHVDAGMLPGLLLGILFGTVALTALGIGCVRFLPSADTAGPMQAFLVMPIAFVSNVFFPLDNAPGWLDKIASALPLKPLADQLHAAFEHTSGSGIVGDDLLTLSIWIVIGGILMMKFMRTITAKA